MIAFDDVRAAAARIAGAVHRTPVLTSARSTRRPARGLVKAENLQRAARSSCAARTRSRRSPQRRRPRAASCPVSGNHAQALAIAARRAGLVGHVLCPRTRRRRRSRRCAATAPRSCSFDRTARIARSSAAPADRARPHARPPVRRPARDGRPGHRRARAAGDVPDLDVLITPVGGGGLSAGPPRRPRRSRPASASSAWSPQPATTRAIARPRGARPRPRGAHDRRRAADRHARERTFAVNSRLSTSRHRGGRGDRRGDGVPARPPEDRRRAQRRLRPRRPAAGAGRPVAGRRVGVVLSGGNVGAARLARLFDDYLGP